jgi:hypothetical protein
MHRCIVFRDVNIQFKCLSLQELHVKVIHFIHKRELSVVKGAETLCELGGLSVVVVEIHCDEGD